MYCLHWHAPVRESYQALQSLGTGSWMPRHCPQTSSSELSHAPRFLRLRLRLHRSSSTPAPDYQNACGTPSQLVHPRRLAAPASLSTWRPFLQRVADPSSQQTTRPLSYRRPSQAVQGATPYVRTPIDHLRPCGPLATSVRSCDRRGLRHCHLSPKTSLHLKTSTGLEPATVGINDRCSTN